MPRTWDESYLALEAFNKSNGHCKVPKSHDNALHQWTTCSRKKFHAGTLANYEFQMLNKLNFDWNHGMSVASRHSLVSLESDESVSHQGNVQLENGSNHQTPQALRKNKTAFRDNDGPVMAQNKRQKLNGAKAVAPTRATTAGSSTPKKPGMVAASLIGITALKKRNEALVVEEHAKGKGFDTEILQLVVGFGELEGILMSNLPAATPEAAESLTLTALRAANYQKKEFLEKFGTLLNKIVEELMPESVFE